MSQEEHEEMRYENAGRMERRREGLSQQQHEEMRLENAGRMARRRETMSQEEHEEMRYENAGRMERRREGLSQQQQHEEMRFENAGRMARRREVMSQEEREERRRQDAAGHMARRQEQRQRRSIMSERRVAVDHSLAILSGQMDVIPCSIGRRSECVYCNAKLWAHETRWRGICCGKGKIIIEKWRRRHLDSHDEHERYAARIHALWDESNDEGRLLKEFARPLNNALALASQVVDETICRREQQRIWMPNVVIQGKLYHKIGYSLLPPQGMIPRFAQIYVYDPQQYCFWTLITRLHDSQCKTYPYC
jgi:hypothetical protein